MQRNRLRSKALGALSVITLVTVAACGDDDSGGEGSAPSGTEVLTEDTGAPSEDTEATSGDTEAPSDSSAPSGDTAAPSEDTAAPTTEGGAEEVPEAPGERHVTEDEGEPVKGGTLRYGIDSDSANPFAPFGVSCATSCYVVLSSVSDPLFNYDADGEPVPQLLESAEPNADYTEWTLTVKEGITFHDGTPLDGEAVKFNMETCINSPLTAGAYAPNIEALAAEGQTVTVTARGPWVALPHYFSVGQCGYMFSPQWLASLPNVPHRAEGSPVFDAELAATPADGNAAAAVGLGAFVYESYEPGNGNAFRAVRNEDYWRGPNGITGEDLPYLDAIEVVVFVDAESRANALRSGEISAMHTANADYVSQFIDNDEFELTSGQRFAETSYILVNNTADPALDPEGANAESPLTNVNCRRALAHATDNERFAEERGRGLTSPANGPFPPGSLGYLEDSGYPAYDPDAAIEAMDLCLSELGTDSIEFAFNTTNDPFNVESNSLIISMWTEVFGDQVRATITPIEQGAYIGLALTGAFQAQGWRQHGSADPDQERLWWSSANAGPIGGLSLNFGRLQDDVIDENLEIIKTDPDEDARREAAEAINQRFGEQAYYLWNVWALWGVPTLPSVNGIETNILVDSGEQGVGIAFAGRHYVNQIWCDDGACE